jgi:high-affinity nickel permease
MKVLHLKVPLSWLFLSITVRGNEIMAESSHLITLLGLGLLLGLKHALDADHVVAVSTIVSQTGSLKKSSFYGVIWGLGHTVTLLIAGGIILGFKLAMPDKMALGFEFLVGIVLVILGLDVIRRMIKEKIHVHAHDHSGISHTHFHSHGKRTTHSHAHKSFIVGMVHGLAGSAALTLLVLSTVKSVFQGLMYILVFGAGSIAGMFIVSTIIGLPFVLAAKFEKMHTLIGFLAGTISIVLGIMIMYEIGYTQKLFS